MARAFRQINKKIKQERTEKAENLCSLRLLLLNPDRRLCMIDYKPIMAISIKQIQCRNHQQLLAKVDAVPLTPTLSLGEREDLRQFLGKTEALRSSDAASSSPSPRGRGPG